jgi:hypothetical protein
LHRSMASAFLNGIPAAVHGGGIWICYAVSSVMHNAPTTDMEHNRTCIARRSNS